MNDEYQNEEEQSSLETIGNTLNQGRNLSNNFRNNKLNKSKLNSKETVKPKKNNLPLKSNSGITLSPSKGEKNIVSDVSGVASKIGFFAKHKWLIIGICGGSLFFFIIIIAVILLAQNANNFNYITGNFYANENYQRLYQEIEKVEDEYKKKYNVKIDKYLMISMITSYQDNSAYRDDTESGIYEILEQYENRSKMNVMIETLAKYQIKTIKKCSNNSSSMRKIASNDDKTNIINFWMSELAKEKNYDCSGDSVIPKYEISTEKGNINDENSGSVFYWNLIDEGFFKEYYPNYFSNLSEEEYEKKAVETLDYIYMYAENLKEYDKTVTKTSSCNGNAFWWPIGSEEVELNDDKYIAGGNPINSTIVSNFSDSGSIKIVSNYNDVNIIAAKSGVVVYPTDLSQTKYSNDGISTDGDGYGNYVIIEHSDGTYTLYAHLEPNSITVLAGDSVIQGEVIAKMGKSGNASRKMLRFEVRVGTNSSSSRANPEEYVSLDDPRSNCSEFSLTDTSLTKQEFVSLMNWYCISTNNKGFCENFSSNAELVYEVSIKNNVNPELVVVTAGTEQSWNKCDGLYNFWGIGISNGQGCHDGPRITSLEDGIKRYANLINTYLEGGTHEKTILARYNKRAEAGCDSAGHGLPGTLAGMQSVYSWVGTYRYNPGNWGLGGCAYLNLIYGKGYCNSVPTCTDKNNCSVASKTTICEQNDYTAWQLKGKVELRQKIFGL